MKLLIETGSESHTSSYASMQAKYHGGEYDGKFLYQVKERQVSAEWSTSKHARWVKEVYEIPEGTQIEVIGKAFDNKVHRIYRLDPSVDVFDEDVLQSRLHSGRVKGRLVLVKDILASKEAAVKQSQEEGF